MTRPTAADYVRSATGQVDPFVPADVAAPAGASRIGPRIARRRRPYLGYHRLGGR